MAAELRKPSAGSPFQARTAEESHELYKQMYGRCRPWQEPGRSWVEFEELEPWTVAFGFTSRDGHLELCEVHVVPTHDSEEDRGWNFRERGRPPNQWSGDPWLVPAGGLAITALRDMVTNLNEALQVALSATPPPDSHLAHAGFVGADSRPRGPRPPRRHTDEKLAIAAVLYEKAARDGDLIATYLADQLTRRGFATAPGTIRNLVARTRQRKFLIGETKQGRRGGRASDEAKAIAQEWLGQTNRGTLNTEEPPSE